MRRSIDFSLVSARSFRSVVELVRWATAWRRRVRPEPARRRADRSHSRGRAHPRSLRRGSSWSDLERRSLRRQDATTRVGSTLPAPGSGRCAGGRKRAGLRRAELLSDRVTRNTAPGWRPYVVWSRRVNAPPAARTMKSTPASSSATPTTRLNSDSCVAM